MRVGFAGDWHGNTHWSQSTLRGFHEAGVTVIYHAGDFGLWPGVHGDEFLQKIQLTLKQYKQTLFVTLGNHEDYNRVPEMVDAGGGWLMDPKYPLIMFAPRGHAWVTENGTKMASLGGAFSVDRWIAGRREGVSWWPQEAITVEDGEALARNTEGWDRVDVMITHDAPAGLHRLGMQPPPSWLTPEIVHEAWQQRVILREAMDAVAPRWLVHGHWHEWARDSWDGVSLDETDYTCEVIGLDCDGVNRNAITAELAPGVGLVNINVMLAPAQWVTLH